MVDHDYVFLVAPAGLHSPVEWASDQEQIIHYDELVVHVEIRFVVGPDRDALLSQPFDVAALVVHALVVRDDLHSQSPLPDLIHCVGQFVVGQVEHTYLQRLLGLTQVWHQLVDVLVIWEEESV